MNVFLPGQEKKSPGIQEEYRSRNPIFSAIGRREGWMMAGWRCFQIVGENKSKKPWAELKKTKEKWNKISAWQQGKQTPLKVLNKPELPDLFHKYLLVQLIRIHNFSWWFIMIKCSFKNPHKQRATNKLWELYGCSLHSPIYHQGWREIAWKVISEWTGRGKKK